MNTFAGYMERLSREASAAKFSVLKSEEGRALSVNDDVVIVSGLSTAQIQELLEFESGDTGIAYSLNSDTIGVIRLKKGKGVRAGDRVFKTGRVSSIGVGEALLGRVIDPLGYPLDERPSPARLIEYSIERDAPPLVNREYVSRPLYTGIKAIDSMLPIGMGQRELIAGDPSTGKTSIALSAMANQKRGKVISVYVCIGQKKDEAAKVIEEITHYGDMSKTVFIIADASCSMGLQFIAPYSAASVAEYFMDRGDDVLIVFDDLTKHAMAYRSLSLLLRRPVGREAYPGDIFFIHSRLLERAANISELHGGGSITALPIVETQQGRISAYIPTNLISITDGQIYLDLALFNKGIRPAIDMGRSVSRIGGKAQAELMRTVSGRLKIDYSRFLEAEVFTKFGARLEDETARLLRHGERLRELLKQQRTRLFSMEEEILNFLILESGRLEEVELFSLRDFCDILIKETKKTMPDLVSKIRETGRLSNDEINRLREFFKGRAIHELPLRDSGSDRNNKR